MRPLFLRDRQGGDFKEMTTGVGLALRGRSRPTPPLAGALALVGALIAVPISARGRATDNTPFSTGAGHASDSLQNPVSAGASAQTGGSQPAKPSVSSPQHDERPENRQQGEHSLSVNPVTGLVTASASEYQPLTGSERLKLYFKMNYLSAGAYFGPVFSALVLDQTTNSPSQWGGGFRGYGRRVASRTANAILQGTFQAPAAAALHEDVRYIASGKPGFKRRAWHALVYSFLTYNDEGRPTLNIANLGSYYASTAVSTAWLPGRYNLAGYTFSNGTEQIGLSLPVNLMQEFWPEIHRYVLRGR